MSGRIVGEVLDNAPEDLTHLELAILVALAEQARQDTRIATHKTTRDALAHRCRTTPGTVKNVIKTLRLRGLIEPVNGTVHRGVSQHYRIAKLGPEHRTATWERGITR